MNAVYRLMDAVLPFAFLRFTFMKNALLAIVLMTPLLSLMGTMTVNQRMAFFSDALGHSALTGVGLGIVFGLKSDLAAMLLFGILWALLISRIKQSGAASADTVISVFASSGIALGVVILSRGGGFAKYSPLLIGDILAVMPSDIALLAAALAAVIIVWALIYNALLMTGINISLARSRGIRTRGVEYIFSALVAVCVMLAIRWVGVMLINALLILPAAAGRLLARSSRGHAIGSVLIGLAAGIVGLVASYYLDIASGAAIVLAAAGLYALCLAVRSLTRNGWIIRSRQRGQTPG